MEKSEKSKIGKRNRKKGTEFERVVRRELESQGLIVIKNPNNIVGGEFIQGKSKYNPHTKRLMMNSGGFPDFIAYNNKSNFKVDNHYFFEIIGIEAKSNGYLDKDEKEKCSWLLKNNILSRILIASKPKAKDKSQDKIIYKEFKNGRL